MADSLGLPQGVTNVAQLRQAARAALSEEAFAYFDAAAGRRVTYANNQRSWDTFSIVPRVLQGIDVGSLNTSVEVLGGVVGSPIMVAPTAHHDYADPDGEVATARGAADAGSIMIISSSASKTIEEVTTAASGTYWFQLYVFRDLQWTEELVRRAKQARCEALVVTVDVITPGRRSGADYYHRGSSGGKPEMANIPPSVRSYDPTRVMAEAVKGDLSVDDLRWLRRIAGDTPLVVKGVLHPADAKMCVELGVDGIIVSNHGGRQLDGALSTADALSHIVEAVDGRCEVYVDGGLQDGTDVLRALSMGARAVLLGRPVLWGLAVDGATGVEAVLNFYHDDLKRAMALSGATDLEDLRNVTVERTDYLAIEPTWKE